MMTRLFLKKSYIEQICETVEYQASYVQQLSYSVFLHRKIRNEKK